MDLDVDQFIKDMGSIMKYSDNEAANGNIEEGSSSDPDFGEISCLSLLLSSSSLSCYILTILFVFIF